MDEQETHQPQNLPPPGMINTDVAARLMRRRGNADLSSVASEGSEPDQTKTGIVIDLSEIVRVLIFLGVLGIGLGVYYRYFA